MRSLQFTQTKTKCEFRFKNNIKMNWKQKKISENNERKNLKSDGEALNGRSHRKKRTTTLNSSKKMFSKLLTIKVQIILCNPNFFSHFIIILPLSIRFFRYRMRKLFNSNK